MGGRNLGTTSSAVGFLFMGGASIYDTGGSARITGFGTTSAFDYVGKANNADRAYGHNFCTSTIFSNATAYAAIFRNGPGLGNLSAQDANRRTGIHHSGRIDFFQAADVSGTPAPTATVNAPAGKVAIAAGQSSVTVANSVVTANSIVCARVEGAVADATLTDVPRYSVGAGTMTIFGNAAATADVKVGFVVFHG
jgi:hypothetical protein